MATEDRLKKIAITATADLSSGALDNTGVLHKAVTLNGAIAPTPNLAGGLLKNKGAIGEPVAVAVEGLMKGWAGAAISTVGYPVTITASGFIIAASSGDYTIGKTLEIAASGDLRPFLLDFANLGYYKG